MSNRLRKQTHYYSYIVLMCKIEVRLSKPLSSNVNYSGRTAPLTPKVAFYIFIQQIYVLNILNMVCTLHRGPGFDPRRYQIF